MKKGIIVIALVVTLGLAGITHADCMGCFSNHEGVMPVNENESEPPSPSTTPLSNNDKIKIANFNIQVFGVTKASKENVMQQLAEIISNFDIVSIQEIRDISETAIEDLEVAVDRLGVDYEYILGPRLGRTSSKEQYAYMYRTTTITYEDSCTYDDSEQDLFHREPLMARFKATAGNFDFVLLSIHVDPDLATEEISSLPLAISDAQNHFSTETDFILLGDLNADCSYFDEEDQTISLRDPQYTWLIDNSQDTNVASSDCTYDRIIMLDSSKEDYTGVSGVFKFDDEFGLTYDEATDISDHYPVWSEFYINKDTDAVNNTYYRDSDTDGYGDPSSPYEAASQPSGYVSNDSDCNDNDSTIYPGATEIKGDGIDQDCNGCDFHDLDNPGSRSILANSSPVTVPAKSVSQIYGCAGANNVVVEAGAGVKLLNMSGSNTITIQAASNIFSVYRSGATVTFEGTDGTVLVLPATTTAQSIIFNDKSLDLKIESGSVMLGEQVVGLAGALVQ